jgi:hypothetical protein
MRKEKNLSKYRERKKEKRKCLELTTEKGKKKSLTEKILN